jgi:hypothetical protein
VPDEKEKQEERARRLQELIDADDLPKPTSPHAFVQEQMRKNEQARRAGKPAAPESEEKTD